VSRTFIYAVEASELINQLKGLLLCHHQAILANLVALGCQSDHRLEGIMLMIASALPKILTMQGLLKL
jgi:hypothetical protein